MKRVPMSASGGVSGARLFQEHVLGASPDLDFRSVRTIWLIVRAVLDPVRSRRVKIDPLGVCVKVLGASV